MGADPGKYWAFISYSHRDARAAAALQRAIETYRLPNRLVGRRTPQGVVPAYLKPIFRDRDELEAGVSLKETVRAALAGSRWLIVVCSPNAARSPWVNREITEFKRLHGEARVLACIVAGEPFAHRMPGREAEECFPEALRCAVGADGQARGEELEPMAADLRPQGDGRRRAMLKLVAGMVGVGVDELVQRDAYRRARRMAALAAASLAGMAIMAVLAVMAVRSRIEAESQRVQAEDMIEFMLGDLRRRLDAVGRLDVLDAVGGKALAYYGRQDAGGLDADALGRRSRAMHLIGELREKRGDLADALVAFQSAADTTEQLLARAPHDGRRIFDHAQSVYWVGYIAWRRGAAQQAEVAFLRYRDLARELVRIDPKNVDWQMETGYASQNLGVVQLERLRPTEALQAFTEAKDVRARLIAAKPDQRFELADAHGWIARALEASGDYAGAVRAQQDRLEVLAPAADAARDRRVQQQVMNANYELCRQHLNLGDAGSAERYAMVALEQADAMAASDPANLFWLSQGGFHRLALAEVELALGKWAQARAHIEATMGVIARVTASDASVLIWQVKLRGRGLVLQTLLGLAEKKPPAPAELEAYVASVRRLESAGTRLNAEHASLVAAAELLLGDLLHHDGPADAAAEHWRAAARRLQPFARAHNHSALTLIARAQLRLGNLEEAGALAAQLRASEYRHPAYADLINELSRGRGT